MGLLDLIKRFFRSIGNIFHWWKKRETKIKDEKDHLKKAEKAVNNKERAEGEEEKEATKLEKYFYKLTKLFIGQKEARVKQEVVRFIEVFSKLEDETLKKEVTDVDFIVKEWKRFVNYMRTPGEVIDVDKRETLIKKISDHMKKFEVDLEHEIEASKEEEREIGGAEDDNLIETGVSTAVADHETAVEEATDDQLKEEVETEEKQTVGQG